MMALGFDIEAVAWSDPKTVTTRGGDKVIREWAISDAPQDEQDAFWAEWKTGTLKAAGFRVNKWQGVWKLTDWRTASGQGEVNRVEVAKQEETERRERHAESYNPELTGEQAERFDTVTGWLTSGRVAGKRFSLPGEYDYQLPHIKRMVAALNNGFGVDASDTGCHAKGTLILMSSGQQKKVEDIAVSDDVMGWDGNPQKVMRLARGREAMVRITPTKGEPFEVNRSHILTLQYTKASPKSGMGKYSGKIIDITVEDYLTLSKTHKHSLKLFRVGVEFEWRKLPMAPYHLGVLLGDGGLTRSDHLRITKPDVEIQTVALEIANKYDCGLRTEWRTATNPSYCFTNASKLWEALKLCGAAGHLSPDKFVPFAFKVGSSAQRMDLLAGLLDTDGHLSCNGYEFSSASKQLAEDVVFVARSVGLAAYLSPKFCKSYSGNTYWRAFISGDVSQIPLRIKRKQARARKQVKDVKRTGFTIEPLSVSDFYGFALDGDGRFCLGDFTVTHNTGKTAAAILCAYVLDRDLFVLSPIPVLPAWSAMADIYGVEVVDAINYEKVRTGKTPYGTWLASANGKIVKHRFAWRTEELDPARTLIVADEAQKLKDFTTQNCKLGVAAIEQGYKVMALSATIADNPMHMKVIALGSRMIRRAGDFYGWLSGQGVKKGRFGLFFVGGRPVLTRLHAQIFPMHGSRMRISELGDKFPESKIISEAYQMPESDAIQKVYDEMNAEIAKLEAREANDHHSAQAEIVIAQLRARQRTELLKVPTFVQMAQDAIDEGSSVALFVNFEDSLRAIALRLGTNALIHGGQSMDDREAIRVSFQEDKSHVIVCNTRAGGVGISLHGSKESRPRLSLISPTFSGQDLKQLLGRVWRAGGAKSVQKILWAADTVEADMAPKVRGKLNRIDLLNDGELDEALAI